MLQVTFPAYCDIHLRETASQTRKNVGRDFFCPWGIDWMVVACDWQVVLPVNTSSEKRCCCKREGKLFGLKITRCMIKKKKRKSVHWSIIYNKPCNIR